MREVVNKPTYINKMKDSAGKEFSLLLGINGVFAEYYQNLYTEGPYDEKSACQILNKVNLPTLTTEQQDSLNRPLTTEEIRTVINDLPLGKSPDPDGYTGEFCKTF